VNTEHASDIALASNTSQASITKDLQTQDFHPKVQPSPTRKWGWRDVCCLFIIALLVAAMVYRYIPDISSNVAGQWWDPLLNMWTLSWNTTTLLHDPLNLWQGQLLYPNSLTLSYTENLLGETLFYAPIFLLTHNPVLSYNLVFYFTFFLCGANMYILARHHTGNPLAALVAGLIYAFSPYRIGQIDHIHIVAGHWMPLVLLYLDLALASNRWRHWSLFGVFYVLQILSSIYYGIFISYALLTYVTIRYARPVVAQWWKEYRQRPRLGRQPLRTRMKRFFAAVRAFARYAKKPLVIFAAICVMLGTLMLPYLLSLTSGLERNLNQTATFSAYVRDFTFTAPFNWLHGIATYNGVALPYDSEHYLFLGWVVVILMIPAIMLGLRTYRPGIRAYVWTAVILLIFSFGPFLQYATTSGAPFIPTANTVSLVDAPGWPMPWFLAYFALPGFKGLRVPARLTGVLLLFLALLAAYSVAWLTESAQKRTKVERPKQPQAALPLLRRPGFSRVRSVLVNAALFIIPLAVVLEGVPAYLPITHVPTGNQIPPVYSWLATHAGQAPIVELPMAHLDESFTTKDEAWYDYYAIYHPHPIMNGWSGYHPPLTVSIAESLMSFPANDSVETLRSYGVYYIVLHRQLYPPNVAPYVMAAVHADKDLQLIASFGDDTVWQVK
jgi:hypothetical protein